MRNGHDDAEGGLPDLDALGSDAPDLSSISDALLCPFEVVKLRNPRVAWLNARWLFDQGIDARCERTLSRIGEWLINRFGYVVDQPEYTDAQLDRQQVSTFYADRYGSNNGLVAHGGSGRAAAMGHFHIKGVGRTPLVGRGADRAHSHGAASLNVALREAIYAEVCDEEFPFGAVPVVAILDTGLDFESSTTPARRLRRALLVRPSMLRTSHMQRAAGFIDPLDGHENSQPEDALRVRDVIAHFVNAAGGGRFGGLALIRHFTCLAAQVAFGQVHRLYNGGYFSSNISLDARLLDFGNMHALPNWVNARVLESDLGFGKEMKSLEATIRSLEFHFSKYGNEAAFDGNVALAATKQAYERAFDSECVRVLGLDTGNERPEAKRRSITALRSLFARQQRESHYCTRHGSSKHGWMRPLLEPDDACTGDAQWQAHYDQIMQEAWATTCPADEGVKRIRLSLTTRRYLMPRRSLSRERLQGEVDELLASSTDVPNREISRYIERTVCVSRRHWPQLPAGFIVHAHAHQAGQSVLEGTMGDDGRACYWLEGFIHHDSAWLFDECFELAGITAAGGKIRGFRWSLLVHRDHEVNSLLRIGLREVRLPEMSVFYSKDESAFHGALSHRATTLGGSTQGQE